MDEPSELSADTDTKNEEKPREKICISISEGCIRHYNEDPEIEEQFILRLPENEANIVHEALETDTLEKRLTICVQKSQREAFVALDGEHLNGKILDLPTVVESYKLADESTLYKTADISQILICNNAPNPSPCYDKQFQKPESKIANDYKYANGLCPPLKNARKKRFRKIQLEENFDPNVDRAVKLLLRADGAADRIHYEIAMEETDENPSTIDDDSISLLSPSNEVDVFGEALSVSSNDDATYQENNDEFVDTNIRISDRESDFDSDIGNIENYDLETLTEEQKQYLAHLKEVDWCLSNYDYKVSPPRQSTRGRGRGRGRGRPRMQTKPPKQYKYKKSTHESMAGRGGRGRPPGRGRGRG